MMIAENKRREMVRLMRADDRRRIVDVNDRGAIVCVRIRDHLQEAVRLLTRLSLSLCWRRASSHCQSVEGWEREN